MKRAYLTHSGAFVGNGPRIDRPVYWKVELYRLLEDGTGPATPGELRFPAESPLTIEWDKWTPEKAVQGSMLTLRVESMRDREFLDYYTRKQGSIYIKVYRRGWCLSDDWQLCWRGALDPEFYEEPYETLKGYDVTMTFSDFGGLDRIDFRRFTEYGGGRRDAYISLEGLVAQALELACVVDRDIDWLENHEIMTGSALYDFDGNKYDLTDLRKIQVCFDNFEDEEGEPMTWRAVLEAVLMPLGLHIVQRGGKILIYDIDYLAQQSDPADGIYVHWSSTSQTLGTAETYNNIKLTFSPYAKPRLMDGNIEPDTTESDALRRIFGNAYRNTYYSGGVATHNIYQAFKITRTRKGTGARYVYAADRPYIKFEALNGTCPDTTGVIFPHAPQYTGVKGDTPSLTSTRDLVRMDSVHVPQSIDGSLLRLSIDMLLDPRYNPFEPADTGTDERLNNKAERETFEQTVRWVAVPLRILLRDNSGNITHYYRNTDDFIFPKTGTRIVGGISRGKWYEYTEGTSLNGKCYAQWYADKADDCPLNGWTTNRPTVGIWPNAGDLEEYYARMTKGMLMAYPPHAGYIDIAILDGVLPFRRNDGTAWPHDDNGDLEEVSVGVLAEDAKTIAKCKWRCFRNIALSVVTPSGAWEEVTSEDSVTEGAVDCDAREELSVDTVCGTVKTPRTSMLGLYMLAPTSTDDCRPVWSMTRSGMRNYMERILIGGLFSQYARRRTTLSGEATECVMSLPVFFDHNTEGAFIVAASTLDAMAGTEDLELVQIFPDNYEAEPIDDLLENKFEPQETEPPELDYDLDTPWDTDRDDPGDVDPGDVDPGADPWDDWFDPWDDEREY